MTTENTGRPFGVDQIETRVRAFHAAHVCAPLKRQTDVVDRLEALADR